MVKVLNSFACQQLVNRLLAGNRNCSLQGDIEGPLMPLADAPHVRLAIAQFRRWRFPNDGARIAAARRIALAAEQFGTVL